MRNFAAGKKSIARLSLILIALFAIAPRGVRGEGSETSSRGDDFELNVDSRWTGCEYGGYLPLRMRIVNHGVTRNVRIVMTSEDYNQNLAVEREVSAPQNAVVRTTLSVPMVGGGTYATIKVFGPEGEIKALRQSVTMPRTTGLQDFSPALLAVSSAPVDFTPWRECMYRFLSTSGTHTSYGHYGSYTTIGEINNQEVVPASSLPDNWIDYTGLDVVCVSMDDFASLSNEQRGAIRKWVHSGGNLFLTGVGKWDDNRAQAERLLESNLVLNASPDWTPAELGTRESIQSGLRPVAQIELERAASMGRGMPMTGAGPAGGAAPVAASPEYKWSTEGGVFRSRRLMLGTVYAFQDDPFPGSDADWSWWRSHYPNEEAWIQRQGFSSRQGNEEFLDFLIPGIQRFPVTAFIVLITLFSVVIGPVNYFYFLRKKQLAIIVITIPAIAFLTSVSLFSFSALSHGFSIKSRMRSMTLVDQRAQTAITFSRNSLYAGFAPSEGLAFRPDTAVYPLWNVGQAFQNGRIDMTDGQRFYSGWFPSRTRTQFVTATYEDQRSRGGGARGTRRKGNAWSSRMVFHTASRRWAFMEPTVNTTSATTSPPAPRPSFRGRSPETRRSSSSWPARINRRCLQKWLKREPITAPTDMARERTTTRITSPLIFPRTKSPHCSTVANGSPRRRIPSRFSTASRFMSEFSRKTRASIWESRTQKNSPQPILLLDFTSDIV
ncbi:MAG: hypothetical protein WEB58_20115 [Planctomycetaceae bacterium]